MSAPGAVRSIIEQDRYLLVARLSLFVAIVNNHSEPVMAVFFGVLAAALFFQERWLRSPWPWLASAAVLGWVQFGEWWLVDDHPVAATYWLLAIGCSRLAVKPDVVLAGSARLLLGALFALAFGWKLLSPQYMSGDFFEYHLLRDDRFEPVATLVGGADAADLAVDRAAIVDLTATGDAGDSVLVAEGPRTRTVAEVFTWYGLLMEGAVAAAFLAPWQGRRASLLRTSLLLTFCATTYAVVPVAGFAVLLLTMGMAQTPVPSHRFAHLCVGVGIVVWNSILVTLIL